MHTSARAAELLLRTRSPVVIASGPELRAMHNEAFALLMGNAGRAMPNGTPLRELSPELWERARPLEVYPTLRARRLPELSVPPLLVASPRQMGWLMVCLPAYET